MQENIARLPDDFFTSFNYTCTGNNLTHPLVFGLLARFAWGVEGVTYVGLDQAFNEGQGVKFKPDVIGYKGSLSDGENFQPIFFLDYESPNSSDWRTVEKDVDGYIKWSDHTGTTAPYVIITTLPKTPVSWECRWTSKGYYNYEYRERKEEWLKSPRNFWCGVYAPELAKRSMKNIVILNIDGKSVSRIFPA